MLTKVVADVAVTVLEAADTTKMNSEQLTSLILNDFPQCTPEFKRIFHGRGGCYPGWEFLTIDSIDRVLNVALFAEVSDAPLNELIALLKLVYQKKTWDCIVLQKRYLSGCPSTLICGSLPDECVAIENGLNYKLNLLNNRNSGFFPDMTIGREFVATHAPGKRVLNLFSYTCSFSVVAIAAGAESVVNVDMSKGALSTGRENHRINGISTKAVSFMPYNILKSWGRIKKAGPYDLIVIDPPSFQKGSFAATKDYVKIIKRLSELASETCVVLSALNSPDLDSKFILDIFEEHAPEFTFIERLPEMETFPSLESERALKNLIFKKG